MTSVAILSVLVVLLAGVFSQVSRTWTAGEGNIERRRSARALTDYIGAELRSAALPAEVRGVSGKGNLQFLINPPTSQVPDAYRNADAVFWTAPLATEASFGEIAEIGYFVRWIEPDARALQKGQTAPRPALCRFFVNPSREKKPPAGSAGPPPPREMEPNPNFLAYSSNPNAWLTGAILDEVADAKAPTYKGLFGENVVGLWVEAFGLDGRKLDRSFYSLPTASDDALNKKTPKPDLAGQKVGYLFKRPYVSLAGASTSREELLYLPARVRVSIAQIDSHHLTRLDPVSDQVRALAKESSITNAEEFEAALRKRANGTGLAPLLPGLRTYTTEVQLENSR